MPKVGEEIKKVLNELPIGVELVAVSKFHSSEDILDAYNAGQRIFGENRPQEMTEVQNFAQRYKMAHDRAFADQQSKDDSTVCFYD